MRFKHAERVVGLVDDSFFKGKILTSLYQPVRENRHFSQEQRFSDVNWNSLNQVITAYENRIENWYFKPVNMLAAHWHFSFSVLAIDCLLMDTLSYLNNPTEINNYARFTGYCKAKFRRFNQRLPKRIESIDEKGNRVDLIDVADVFYNGVRNGILHEAHCALYASLEQLGNATFAIHETGLAVYSANNSPCVSVAFDPQELLKEIETVFASYFSNLRNPSRSHDVLRGKFKIEIERRFGVPIPATLDASTSGTT